MTCGGGDETTEDTTVAYAAKYSTGEIRLYESEAAAKKHEEKRPFDQCIQSGVEVNAALHFRGKIPSYGVCFGPHDQSYRQLIVQMP